MAWSIAFSEEKNQLLAATRGVCFDDVIRAMSSGAVIAEKQHPSARFKHQRIFVMEINGYAYVVPYVLNVQKNEIFLKTIYPSRVLTKRYLKGGRK